MTVRSIHARALALIAGAIGLGVAASFWQAARAAPPPTMPEVIAPGQLPTLQAIRSDSGAGIAATAPAPMPDADAAAPIAAPSDAPRVAPTMFFQKTEFNGNGLTAGSGDHARTQQPATGVSLDVPLD